MQHSSSANLTLNPDKAGSFQSLLVLLKLTKFVTATIKTLCHSSHPTDFVYHLDSGRSHDQLKPGSQFQQTTEAGRREPGNKVTPTETSTHLSNMTIFLLYRDGTYKFSHTIQNEPQQSQANQDDISTLGHGVLCCFSNSGKLFALCTPQKELFIWQTGDWKLLSKRSQITFLS